MSGKSQSTTRSGDSVGEYAAGSCLRLVVRDLRIHAQALDASVFHYRDSTDLEADAIVERRDGAWAAFEVKLGQGAIDRAAESLLRVAARVDPAKHGKPAVLRVITGWGYGYRRPDGVAGPAWTRFPIARLRFVVSRYQWCFDGVTY
jgi:hypothetical protein